MIDLKTACAYAILSKSGISTVPYSNVVGNIGVSPIGAAAMTGFSMAEDVGGQFALSSQVTGEAHGASYGGAVANELSVAVLAMQNAYTDAASRVNTDKTRKNVGGGDIGGLTLTPGVYTFTKDILITKDITLEGGPDDVFIFQCTKDVAQSVNTKVILSGGVQAKNVVWQNAGSVKIQPGASMQGIILCFTDVTIETGASVNGAIFAQTAVALQKATVTSDVGMCAEPASAAPSTDVPSTGPSVSPSESPSTGPSAAPSGSPSTGPTSVPSVVPSAGPSSAPSGCEDKTDGVFTLTQGKTCSLFKKEPITVVSRTDETVTFEVKQSWKGKDSIKGESSTQASTEIGWIATSYVEKGVAICETAEIVPENVVLTYTVDCDASGYAEVEIYVHDSEFDAILDDAVSPSKCGISEQGQQCQYTKRFACGCWSPTEAPATFTRTKEVQFGRTNQVRTDKPVSTPTFHPHMDCN
jgi:hypothetical protein